MTNNNNNQQQQQQQRWWTMTMDYDGSYPLRGAFFSGVFFLLFSFLLISYYFFRQLPPLYATTTHWRTAKLPQNNNDKRLETCLCLEPQKYVFFFFSFSFFLFLSTLLIVLYRFTSNAHHNIPRWRRWMATLMSPNCHQTRETRTATRRGGGGRWQWGGWGLETQAPVCFFFWFFIHTLLMFIHRLQNIH